VHAHDDGDGCRDDGDQEGNAPALQTPNKHAHKAGTRRAALLHMTTEQDGMQASSS
jgi:hypothetical protein